MLSWFGFGHFLSPRFLFFVCVLHSSDFVSLFLSLPPSLPLSNIILGLSSLPVVVVLVLVWRPLVSICEGAGCALFVCLFAFRLLFWVCCPHAGFALSSVYCLLFIFILFSFLFLPLVLTLPPNYSAFFPFLSFFSSAPETKEAMKKISRLSLPVCLSVCLSVCVWAHLAFFLYIFSPPLFYSSIHVFHVH